MLFKKGDIFEIRKKEVLNEEIPHSCGIEHFA